VRAVSQPRGDARWSTVWCPGHYVYIGICIGSADPFSDVSGYRSLGRKPISVVRY